MKKKKLLLLGGSHYLVPVIEAAHEIGCHVITMDYLPNNVAHKLSDEYANVSITDRKEVLRQALKLRVDGVMSFACDPGVVSAAYVAEELGLPFQCSFEAASILQDKGLFRRFLAENNFNTPWAKRYECAEDAIADVQAITWPAIVKPVDSAGSKGVTRVENERECADAIGRAAYYSLCGAVIVEEFLSFEGYHSSADPFTIDGDLRFVTYSDQLFDPEAENPYTPSLIIWPSSMQQAHQTELSNEIQRLMKLLGMRTGIYNIETCVALDGKPYIMEVSPRGGGCKIAELQRLAFDVDLIRAEVRKSVGLDPGDVRQSACDGHWCEMVVHARPDQSGILKRIQIAPEIKSSYLKVCDITAKPGDTVEPFTGANMALGDLFLRFDSRDELDEIVAKADDWLTIELE